MSATSGTGPRPHIPRKDKQKDRGEIHAIIGGPLLAGLKALLGPSVVEVLGKALLAAELGEALLTAQAFHPRRIFASAEKRRLLAQRLSLTLPSARSVACLSRCQIVSLRRAGDDQPEALS